MDAKIWTFGATLFVLLYLTMGVYLDFAALIVALLMAAWVLAEEAEREKGVEYVELELRPAIGFVGIFSLTVIALGPLGPHDMPYLVGPTLTSVQYTYPLVVLHTHPIWFYFPALPLVTGGFLSAYRSSHPVEGVLYRTQPVTSTTKVHVHLHNEHASRSKKGEDDEAEEDDDDEDQEEEKRPAPSTHHLPKPVHAKSRSHAGPQPLRAVALHHPANTTKTRAPARESETL